MSQIQKANKRVIDDNLVAIRQLQHLLADCKDGDNYRAILDSIGLLKEQNTKIIEEQQQYFED